MKDNKLIEKVKEKMYLEYKGIPLYIFCTGFVVLLIVIILISSLIVGLNSNKGEKIKSKSKMIIEEATEKLIKDDDTYAPGGVGEESRIDLQTLKSKGFIKEDIKNEKKESCMKNSYVVIYKENATEYKYTAKIYCGDEKEKIKKSNEKEGMINKILFKNQNGENSNTDVLTGMLFGGKDLKGNLINIKSYSVVIKMKEANRYIEVYNTNEVKVGNKTNQEVNINLKDIIKQEGCFDLKAKVKVVNEKGEYQTKEIKSNKCR